MATKRNGSQQAGLDLKQYRLALAALGLGLIGSWVTFLMGRQEAIDNARESIDTHDAIVAARREMEEQFGELKRRAKSDVAEAIEDIKNAKSAVANLRNGALVAAGAAQERARHPRHLPQGA